MSENQNVKSDNPIIQKCLDIVFGKDIEVDYVDKTGWCYVYCHKKRVFKINKKGTDFAHRNAVYELEINGKTFDFNGSDYPDLDALYNHCITEYKKHEKDRLQSALDFLDGFVEKNLADEMKQPNPDIKAPKLRLWPFCNRNRNR